MWLRNLETILNKMGNFDKYPAYKESGVEWLGEIPAEWEVKRLGYLANCSPSNIDKHSKNNEKTVRLCNYTDVYKNDFITDDMDLMFATASDEQIERYALRAGDIIITKDSETANDIAVPAYIKETLTNVVCGYHLAMIRPYSGLCGKYLFRSFQSKIFNVQFEICSNGITRVGLGSNDLKHGLFLTPPLPEQTAIANFLDEKTAKIDTAIAQKEQMISLLKERKQILIQNAVTKGINPDAKMKDSGVEWIGEIPEGWEVKRFKYLFCQSDLPPLKTDGIVTSYRDGQVTLRSIRRMDGYTEAILEHGYQGVRKGQLVLNSMDAFEGAIGVSESDGKCTPEYVVCDTFNDLNLPEYFAYLLREMALAKYIQVICNAVRQRAVRIRFSNLSRLFFVVPPLPAQKAIVAFIKVSSSQIDKVINIQQQQIAKLKEYKSTLIDNAVTGKIKVG